MRAVLDLIMGDPQADRSVPKTGASARLTIFVAAAMAFIAVLVFALSATVSRVADRWADDLAQSATLRLPAEADQADALLRQAMRVLESTPGVASARALTEEEQTALLQPWFGSDATIEALPIPQLIEVIAGNPAYDFEGLSARLEAEVPGAVLDDHGSWSGPLVAAANRLRVLGWAAILLIGATTAAMITLAVSASLAANAQVIRVLRLVGALDIYIARAFVRRFTLRAGAGAAMGTLAGIIAVLLMPNSETSHGFLVDVGFSGGSWLWPLVIPPITVIIAFCATRSAALRRLKEQT